MNREQFMEFFRNDEQLASLSNDDRAEIFLSVLPDRSDLTKELLSQLANCYGTCYPFDHSHE